ncbi:hypothetical protein MASR2M78_30660 [Treponema sp.]
MTMGTPSPLLSMMNSRLEPKAFTFIGQRANKELGNSFRADCRSVMLSKAMVLGLVPGELQR